MKIIVDRHHNVEWPMDYGWQCRAKTKKDAYVRGLQRVIEDFFPEVYEEAAYGKRQIKAACIEAVEEGKSEIHVHTNDDNTEYWLVLWAEDLDKSHPNVGVGPAEGSEVKDLYSKYDNYWVHVK